MNKLAKFFGLKSPRALIGLFGILFVLVLHTSLCIHIGLSFPEALYHTLLLYVVHAELSITDGVDEKWICLAFWFCRFAAPLLTLSGFIDLFYTYIKPRMFQKNIQDHVVIAGMGRLGTRIYKAILQNGIRNDIVVIDRALPEYSFAGTRQTTFYNADLLEDEAYEMAHMDSAQSIWVATSDDNDNLAITANILTKNSHGHAKIFVHLYEHSLIKNFQAFFNSTANKEIHFFNIYDEIIESYLKEWTDQKIDHLVIIGMGKFGRSALRGIIKTAHQAPVKITVVDRRASDILGRLSFDFKNDGQYEILSTPLYNVQTVAKVKDILSSPGKTLMIVGTDQDFLNLSFACHIVDHMNEQSRIIVKLTSKPSYIDEKFNEKMIFLDSSKETAKVLSNMVKAEISNR